MALRKKLLIVIWFCGICSAIFYSRSILGFSNLKVFHSVSGNDSTVYRWEFQGTHYEYWGLESFQSTDSSGLTIHPNATSPAVLSLQFDSLRQVYQWEFEIEVNGTLSASNYVRLYLTSDQKDFRENNQSYHVQIDGTSGNHYYKLYKQIGARRTTLFTSPPFPNQGPGYKAKVIIKRNNHGEWTIRAEEDGLGSVREILTEQSKIMDNSVPIQTYLGIWFNFTITRRQDFKVQSISLIQNNTTADTTEVESPVLTDSTAFQMVIINEIMANPKGNLHWPDLEYIELYNRSEQPITLSGWEYASTTTKSIIGSVTMAPNTFLILCKEADTALFKTFGNTFGLKRWPALTNTGTTLTLKSVTGKLIDSVSYSDRWYSNSITRQGGWSLERIFLIDPCALNNDWISTRDTAGGTPGKSNSVEIDSMLRTTIIDQKELDENNIVLTFNRQMDTANSSYLTKIYAIKSKNLLTHQSIWESSNTLKITTISPFERSSDYQLIISNIRDCSKESNSFEISFFIPDQIAGQEILISEILFDPYPGGSDFVEIFNSTAKTFDLSELSIATVNSDKWSTLIPITTVPLYIKPGEFKVLTTDPDHLAYIYPKGIKSTFIKVGKLPSFANAQGHAILINHSHNPPILIDSLYYNQKMHHALIKNPKGVSLERVGLNARDFTLRSGPALDGGATPGYRILGQHSISDSKIEQNTRLFFPNGDPTENTLIIDYEFSANTVHANIVIINFVGRRVRHLVNHQSIPTSGKIVWDGRMDNGHISPPGIYTLQFEFYNENGWKLNTKKTCALMFKN